MLHHRIAAPMAREAPKRSAIRPANGWLNAYPMINALNTAPSCTLLSPNSFCTELAAIEMLLRSRYETAAMTNVQKMTTQRKFPTGTVVVLGSRFK